MTSRRRARKSQFLPPSAASAIRSPLIERHLSRLCLHCGLCCNGVLFADVCLVSGDNPTGLANAGLDLVPWRSTRSHNPPLPWPTLSATAEAVLLPWRFQQPCAVLGSDNACRLYSNRPARCRSFECALYLRVKGRSTSVAGAERIVAAALRKVGRLDRILRRLGETNDQRPLFARVRSTRHRFEHQLADRGQAAVYADLTLAAHALRLALGRDFTEPPSLPR